MQLSPYLEMHVDVGSGNVTHDLRLAFSAMRSGERATPDWATRFDGDVATALVATGPGSVKTPRGVVSNTGTETYTLAPTRNGTCN